MATAIPGNVLLRVQLGANREQREMIYIEPGEEKTVRIEVAPGEAEVDGFLLDNGEATEGRITMYVQIQFGREIFTQWVIPNQSFLFRDVPIGEAKLISLTQPTRRTAFIDPVELVSGQVTTLTLNATGAYKVRGFISGRQGNDRILIVALPGARNFEESITFANNRGQYHLEVAGWGNIDDRDQFTIELNTPGTYTLVARTSHQDDYTNTTYHESRIVEVLEHQELITNFQLNY